MSSPLRGRAPEEAGPRASVRDLLPYLAEHRGLLAGVVALQLVNAAASLGQPALVGQIITAVQAGGDYAPLVWAVVGLLVLAAIVGGFAHYLLQRAGTSVVLSSRRRLITRMLRLPIAEFDQRRTGDLVSRVGSDTTLLYAVMTQGLVDALGSAVLFVGALVAMAVLDWVLLALTLAVIAIALLTVGVLSRRVRTASREQQEKVGALAAAVERALSAIRTVRAANATDRETAAILGEADGAYRAGVKVAQASAAIVPLAGITLQLAFLVVLGVGGFRVASGAIPIASLIAFVMFLFLLVLPLGNVFGAITSVNQALGAVGRIQEIIALPSETEADPASEPSLVQSSGDPAETAAGSQESGTSPGVLHRGDAADRAGEAAAIEFDEVRFAYSETAAELHESPDREVLRGVSFRVPRGARVALVGPSGAGKSTILALIERFYDPTSGVVRFGGVDARGIPRERLRASLGYVEQDAPALAGSLRENLLLAAPDATDEECAAVLRAVNLGEVLDRDPAGLNAPVGEEGVMLSGGERQRLAIARALLGGAPILLLDEATASLDGVNEQLLRDAIDAASRDRTVVVIAHRLSTVVDSDLIVVLDHGLVVGQGSHAELVESTPLYRELATHQLLV